MTGPPQRRRATRSGRRWAARYRREDDNKWLECRVLDVSLGGVALELPRNANVPDGRLVIELQSADGSGSGAGIPVRGEVRHVTIRKGGSRVGIEFVELSDVERHVLTDLLDIHADEKQ